MPHADTRDTEQIHSDDIQDIISKPPAWLLRWGIICFFAVLILIGGLSAFIRYPDVVKTKLRISSVNPPKPVVASVSGKLVKLLVNNGQYVTANQPLAYIETWKSKYVLAATYAGRVLFNGIVEENEILEANQPLFYVASGNEQFFGEVPIPQYSMGKIKVGQEVLVKLQSYPFEEYGIITGKLSYISEIPVKDGAFIAKISFGANKFSRLSKPVTLRYGMQADAEIITEETSALKRILGNLLKILY